MFIQNAFENAVCEMASIWSRPQWVNCLFTLLYAGNCLSYALVWFLYIKDAKNMVHLQRGDET